MESVTISYFLPDRIYDAGPVRMLVNNCLRSIHSWMKEIHTAPMYYIILEFYRTVNPMKFVLIKIRLNIFRCFLCSTHFLILIQQDFIHCSIDNIMIILLSIKLISCYGIMPTVLLRSSISIIITKVSQDLTFIRWIPGAMYETGFWLTLWMAYITFYALTSALTYRRVSMWRGWLFYIFNDVTSTGGICHSRFFIRRFYYNFKDISRNIHEFKHSNRLKK